jgi:hypothetical protein
MTAVAGGPGTTMGLWLRALLLGDREGYARLGPLLNRDEKGWNEDEPAVVKAACQLMVREYFRAYKHVSIEAFVADIWDRIAKQRTPPRQEDMETVIRAALNESIEVPPHIRRGELHGIRGAVTANISDILRLDVARIDRLVTEAETTARARGYDPPLSTQT